MKTFTIIDTFGFLFRSYFALPPLKGPNGFPTGLLTGLANFIHQVSEEHASDYIVFALDSKEEGVRKGIDENYKAQRPDVPEDLLKQLPIALAWIEKMGFKSITIPGYEADDVIASLVYATRERDVAIKIVSHDKDLYQLIGGCVSLFDPIKKQSLDAEACFKKYGVTPAQFVDYQSLVGDSADNVPGVKGIGDKSAQKLLQQFATLEGIYTRLNEVEPLRIRNLLEANQESAYRSRELVRLRENLLLDFDLAESIFPETNPLLKIQSDLLDLGMRRALDKIRQDEVRGVQGALLDRREEGRAKAGVSGATSLIQEEEELWQIVEKITPESVVAFDTETDSLDTKKANLVGFSFSLDGEVGYYVPLAHAYLGVGKQISLQEAKRAIEKIFTAQVIGHNLKFDLKVLRHALGFSPENPKIRDSMILAWLVDSSYAVGLDAQMKRWFDHEMILFEETVKKGESFAQVSLEEAARYAGEDAWATYRLYFRLVQELENRGCGALLDLADRLEFPFILTLLEMEERGIRVDVSFFKNLGEEVDLRIKTVSRMIFDLAGGEFNLNSTQQLGGVLFDRLGLPSSKKTKSGYSTDERVLSQLEGSHPIITPLLEYRELFKLKSTYIEPLSRLAAEDQTNRIYTSFLQSGTSTGRLSSKNPNLQNIPVKTEAGRKIRQGFIAQEGHLLMSLDYSQIELRLLAHFSKDPSLIAAFKAGADIHDETAKRIFGAEATKMHRGIAKTINFGLIYGMGARKLSETLQIPLKEAKGYIESYFASFPTVKSFLKSQEERALSQGYTETLLGRRRYFDFSGVAEYQKATYLREAVNTIFQGSAADLIKLSMNAIRDSFGGEDSLGMLLQIHDELIFEAPKERAESFAQEIALIMEGIYPLEIPLVCGISLGANWGMLK